MGLRRGALLADAVVDAERQAGMVAALSVTRWGVRVAPARRTLDGMVAATWPVHPGIRLHCVGVGCDAEAVLHTGTGDPTGDVSLCAPHAAAEGRVADPQRCPGGGVRLTVHTAPGETRATGSRCRRRSSAIPPLRLLPSGSLSSTSMARRSSTATATTRTW